MSPFTVMMGWSRENYVSSILVQKKEGKLKEGRENYCPIVELPREEEVCLP